MSNNNFNSKVSTTRSGKPYRNQLNDNTNDLNDGYNDEETLSSDSNNDVFDGEADQSNLRPPQQIRDYRQLNQQLKQMKELSEENNEENEQTNEHLNKESSDGFYSICRIIIIVISIIMAAISYYLFGGNSFNNQNHKSFHGLSRWQVFEIEFNPKIEQKYDKVLPDYGIKVMKRAVGSVMSKTRISLSSEPAVILLIGSNQRMIDCIENDFVSVINSAYNENNTTRINGKQTNSNDIITKFEQTFDSERKHTIVVKNIESIPTNHIMALHQFTDHQNARFTDSIIILTAISHQNIDLTKDAKPIDMDAIATQLFEMKWKDSMAEDQRSALISRLTPSVVTILNAKNQIKC